MDRRTFLKRASGAVGLVAVGSIPGEYIPRLDGVDPTVEDITIEDARITDTYQIAFTVRNELDVNLKTDYDIIYYRDGDHLDKDDIWPNNEWISIPAGEEVEVRRDAQDGSYEAATSIEVVPRKVINKETIF